MSERKAGSFVVRQSSFQVHHRNMGRSFRNERAMLSPIHLWLADQGFFTKYEFQTPWGICDLVGVRPLGEKTALRATAGITESIGSAQNVAVFLAIPKANSGRGISVDKLAESLGDYVGSGKLERSIKSLRKKRLIAVTPSGRLHRNDHWHPFFDAIVAVEFKLSRVEEVLLQATHHKGITQDSYVALPMATAQRALESKVRDRIIDRGIGVIGLADQVCTILLPPRRSAYPQSVASLHRPVAVC